MDRWLCSKINYLLNTNELVPRIGSHLAWLSEELLYTEKGERKGRWAMSSVVDSRIIWTGQKTRNIVYNEMLNNCLSYSHAVN